MTGAIERRGLVHGAFAGDTGDDRGGVPPTPTPPTRRDYVILLTAAAALQAIAWLLIYRVLVANRIGYVPWLGSDTAYYADRGLRVLYHEWPYTNFPYEYPPLSLLLFMLPPLKGTLATYHTWFAVQMIAIDALAAVVTTAAAARIWPGIGRPFAAACTLALAVVAGGAVAIDRFDGAVALVLAGIVLCLVWDRWAVAGALSGLGFALKLIPIVVLPVVLILAARKRTVVWVALLAVAFAVVPFVPFALHDFHGLRSSLFGMQTGRGLHIESVPAAPFLLAQVLHPGVVHIVFPFASLTVNGPGIAHVAGLAPVFVLALLALVALAAWRSRDVLRTSRETIPPAVLACLLASLCGNKVLSPQHLLWILPLVALCLAGRERSPRVAGVLLLGAMVLTQVEYPWMYYQQVDLRTGALLVIVARNLLLAGAFVVLWSHLWRLRETTAGRPAAR
jgi:hypothetical protein